MFTTAFKQISAALAYIILAALVVVFVPLGVLWSVNTLFPVLSLAYTFWNWLAVVFLTVWIKSNFANVDRR